MNESIASRIRAWDGLSVVVRHDAPTDTWIFIAIHDATLGAPTGGTRIKTYTGPAEGLTDAMRLAEGMTRKWAAMELGYGGAKAVLAVPGPVEGEERAGLLRRYGEVVNALRGGFSTGRDLGTTDADMLTLAEVTPYVHGVDRETGRTRDPGPYTAAGVMAAIRAGLSRRFGTPECHGRSVLVQGLGDVGEPLARELAAGGAHVMLSDLDEDKARRLAGELGGVVVRAAEVYATGCDVFAPCAVGAVINDHTVPLLRCKAVIGSANNQLADEAQAERLHERGILYAPDFIANGGGALAFGLIRQGETDEAVLASRLEGIGTLLARVFDEAEQAGVSTLAAARRRIDARLNEGRQRLAR